MIIQHKLEGTHGAFFVEQEGNILAEMVYSSSNALKMIIEHTEVGEELRGQNIGAQLVAAAVEHARRHHMKILPLCPFAHALLHKKPEYKDILSEPK
ncbi:MAG: N-acetyltransferase [Chitinophagaceae bacterium]|nr:N-acetyltransferase [Chitinophagaceae bacterium]